MIEGSLRIRKLLLYGPKASRTGLGLGLGFWHGGIAVPGFGTNASVYEFVLCGPEPDNRQGKLHGLGVPMRWGRFPKAMLGGSIATEVA